MAFVLLAEPAASVAGVLRRYLEGAGHEVTSVASAEEALRAARERPPAVVLAAGTGALDGEALCRSLRSQGLQVPVLLMYSPDEEHAEERAAQAGAEGGLVGPLKRATVLTCVSLLVQRDEARRASVPAARVPSQPQPPVPMARPEPASTSTSADFEFLKRLMLMEVKRSRRYRYPIALLMVELDRFAERSSALVPAARKGALAEVLGVLVEGVRDIDVAVPFADSRFVVFLPHTPRSGARIVAERLREKLKSVAGLPSGTASVGVAVSEPPAARKDAAPGAPGQAVSFGGLLKDAGDALRRAQAAGGDWVEVASDASRPG
ncbi:response regulator/GGDEF domain-containing protein [Myxococcus stipitatus DSM 14675]|uniref:Response regulator/GGDEF domain-containing protein n=1 Tax=Myxococcus stipitatus (strain DSM 14675 / JCM 12634 / Mx s8) TaxID=1278073 RepID=L7UL50_MYXSD|nr:diguanylate cyclase [Myxococcus stipitatus]AGC47179.1 response regulator/GGDEF domain-containing protein [Myxococcus stipitatus DSM 14675]